MLKGALHVHSTYSDGERSLTELRERYVADGCRFVALSDHADAFDASSVRSYVDESSALSDANFVFVPGLEFGCENRMHVLGYGVTQLCESLDPQQVFQHIEHAGGISVIAHPRDASFSWIESFTVLPAGIETWNSKYDGQYAPRGRTYRLLNRLQKRRRDMLAYYGQDLHWLQQYRQLYTVVHSDTLTVDAIVSSLRTGAFHGLKDARELPSSGILDADLLEEFDRVNARSQRVRKLVSFVNAARKRIGMEVPAPIKARLRRFF